MSKATGKTTDERLLERFSVLAEGADFPVAKISRKIALISTPRCGSSLFCDILRATGQAGDPREWINSRYLHAYGRCLKKKEINLNEYLEFIFRKTTSENGTWSVNFHVDQYQYMLKNGFDAFALGFDHVFYLQRRDKVAQAYSLAKAAATDQWSSHTVSKQEKPVKFGRNRVLRSLLQLSEMETFYEKNLQDRVQETFVYEDFQGEGGRAVFGALFETLGIEADAAGLAPERERQSGRGDAEMVRQVKAYLGLEIAEAD